LCRQIHQELENLTHLKQEGGASIPGKLRQFNLKKPVEELKLDTIVINMEKIALMLWSFLMALVQQRQYGSLHNLTPYHSNIFMICIILLNIQVPQSSFLFHAILSIHLLNMGVKQRYITLLHELGVTVSWTTLAKI